MGNEISNRRIDTFTEEETSMSKPILHKGIWKKLFQGDIPSEL